MTDDQIITEEKPHPVPVYRSSKLGLFLAFLALVLALAALGHSFMMQKMTIQMEQRMSGQQEAISTLKTSQTELQEALQKSEDLAQQQEKIMADWRAAQQGDLAKWRVAEAKYLVTLANDHLQFTHEIALAKILLLHADETMKEVTSDNPHLLEIRKALAVNIAALQAVGEVDETSLFVQLAALKQQIDSLPLPAHPLTADDNKTVAPNADLSWWQQGLQHAWIKLNQIVIVKKYNVSNASPLVLPDEKAFLYQNLQAQLANAMWAVLHHNAPVYQLSLANASTWIKTYFVQDAPTTKAVLDKIQALQKVNLVSPSVNLQDTLRLFDAYLSPHASLNPTS